MFKKTMVLILCIGFVFSLCGCASKPAEADNAVSITENEALQEITSDTTALQENDSEPVSTETQTAEESETAAESEASEPSESDTPKEAVTEPTITTPYAPAITTPSEPAATTPPAETTEPADPPAETEPPVETQPPQTEVPKETEPEPTEPSHPAEPEPAAPPFNISYWITYAKDYAASVGLELDSEAVWCWDNPITANADCIYQERDIQSRLNRYSRDEDITAIWVWAEERSDGSYQLFIGYA